jgi:hypothetical protein
MNKNFFPFYTLSKESATMILSPVLAYQFKPNNQDAGAPNGFQMNILTNNKAIRRLIQHEPSVTKEEFEMELNRYFLLLTGALKARSRVKPVEHSFPFDLTTILSYCVAQYNPEKPIKSRKISTLAQ